VKLDFFNNWFKIHAQLFNFQASKITQSRFFSSELLNFSKTSKNMKIDTLKNVKNHLCDFWLKYFWTKTGRKIDPIKNSNWSFCVQNFIDNINFYPKFGQNKQNEPNFRMTRNLLELVQKSRVHPRQTNWEKRLLTFSRFLSDINFQNSPKLQF
jgi:hypothetical protein